MKQTLNSLNYIMKYNSFKLSELDDIQGMKLLELIAKEKAKGKRNIKIKIKNKGTCVIPINRYEQ